MKKIFSLFALCIIFFSHGSIIYAVDTTGANSSSNGGETKEAAKKGPAQFNETLLFPTKKKEEGKGDKTEKKEGEEKSEEGFSVVGVIDEKSTLLEFIPRAINLVLKFVSPIIFGMFIYSGLRFIYGQDNEEDITASKKFFLYGAVGIVCIAISYSLMKAIYYILA